MFVRSRHWLVIYSQFVCLAILSLIFLGALVTSHDAGLSVPDWPQTYGYNMFTYPYSLWIGGIFFEHSHRLLASLIGLLTVILTTWLFFRAPSRNLRTAGFVALGIVICQGLLGGMTVLFGLPDMVSVAHGVLGQTFLLVIIGIAFHLWWYATDQRSLTAVKESPLIYRVSRIALAAIYLQLIFGAVMRHSGSGLSVLDFPTTGGQLVPRFDVEMMTTINAGRAGFDLAAVSFGQVAIHLIHRFWAVVVMIAVGGLFAVVSKRAAEASPLRVLSKVILGITLAQITLGIWTVLGMRPPWITSVHVVTGALLMGTTFVVVLYSRAAKCSRTSSPCR